MMSLIMQVKTGDGLMGNTDYLLKLLTKLMCVHLFMCTGISSDI